MAESNVNLVFRKGDSAGSELQKAVNEVLAELQNPNSTAAELARSAGLNLDEIREARVEVREGEQGLDPFLTTILVGIAVSAISKVGESLWKDVLWPRLQRKLGIDAVKEQVDEREVSKAD